MLHIKSRVGRSYLSIVVIIFLGGSTGAKDNPDWVTAKKIVQPKVGNFALPVSQQQSPLIAFGQNVIAKGDLMALVYGDWFNGTQQTFAQVAPSILYGINDKCSVYVVVPVAVKFKVEEFESQGVQDLFIQLEGMVYAKETSSWGNEITLVANISLPTGSLSKTPVTGIGAPSFFFGLTASHTSLDWYCFGSSGALLTTPHNNIKFGNQFVYQGGFGKNISYKTERWLLNWLIELDGVYRQRSTFAGATERSSGGNTVLLGPSLWFSTQHLILQGGISTVISEHLFGLQLKNKYYLVLNAGWKF